MPRWRIVRPRAGTAPGLTAQESSGTIVAWGHYVDGHRQPRDDIDRAARRALDGEGFVWLGLKDPTNEDLRRFAVMFDLHPLAVEDAVEGHDRSKLEQFGDTLFMVISTIAYAEHDAVTATSEIISTGQIMVFVGEHFVLTVRRGEQSQLSGVRARLEQYPERLAHGPWEVLYALGDKIIDDYLDVTREMGADVDEIEERVYARQGRNEVDAVYQLKRELIEFRKAVVPLGLPLHSLATREFPAVPDEARPYFRELADHHVQAREAVGSFDEVLSSILDASVARISVADNEDTRKISAWVAIAVVPTLIAGVFGMNFHNMPGLGWYYGYFAVLGLMAAIMLALFIGFKRNHWL